MKYYIIAGEASGDLQGSHLMQSLQSLDPVSEFVHWGGDLMNSVGGLQEKHISDLAFMGFWEVIKNLSTIRKNFKACKQSIEAFSPDALILIDYPGFNLRMAEWAHKKGIHVFYYISPQLWAWKGKRIEKIKKFVDRLFVILPFEKEYYAERGVDVSYYGHPLLEIIESYQSTHPVQDKSGYALFPGSRKQEISTMLPLMMDGAQQIDGTFHISKAPSIPEAFYNEIIDDHSKFQLFSGPSYALFNQSRAAMVTSGTATLECALFGVPQIVCYTGSAISYHIAKRLIHVKYITLANLILDKEIVKELIQSECNSEQISKHFSALLQSDRRQQIESGYYELKEKLRTSETTTVPNLIAQEIIDRLNN